MNYSCRFGWYLYTRYVAADVPDYCKSNTNAILPAEDNCAQFYNCSDPRSTLDPYVGECKYPDLFSSYTMTCGSFTRTLCGSRPEPQAPCKVETQKYVHAVHAFL